MCLSNGNTTQNKHVTHWGNWTGRRGRGPWTRTLHKSRNFRLTTAKYGPNVPSIHLTVAIRLTFVQYVDLTCPVILARVVRILCARVVCIRGTCIRVHVRRIRVCIRPWARVCAKVFRVCVCV